MHSAERVVIVCCENRINIHFAKLADSLGIFRREGYICSPKSRAEDAVELQAITADECSGSAVIKSRAVPCVSRDRNDGERVEQELALIRRQKIVSFKFFAESLAP